MKRGVMYIAIMAILVCGVTATPNTADVNESVTFSIGLNGNQCELSCYMNEMFMFGGYALKDPNGDLVQQSLVNLCDTNNGSVLYNPELTHTVDMSGTYKFCGTMFEYDMNQQTCDATLKDCTIESCIEVEVGTCSIYDHYGTILDYFNQWVQAI